MRVESFLERSARLRPEKTALICDSRRYSYRALDEQANLVASGLSRLGVKRGDRVAVCLDNSVEAVVSVFAILKAGAVFVLVNAVSKPDKVAFLLNDSGAATLVTRGQYAKNLQSSGIGIPSLDTIVVVGDASDVQIDTKRVVAWSGLVAAHQVAEPPLAERGIDLDLAGLIYTSGSSGRPKGVMLTHLNMATAASSVVE